MKTKLNTLKLHYQRELEYYSSQVCEYVEQYGDDGCDYLNHRRSMTSYYRGAYNALIELERIV